VELIGAGTTRQTLNGAFYRVFRIHFREERLDLFDLTTDEIVRVPFTHVEKGLLRSTRALCYASVQGKTIRDSLCLLDTSHPHFSREMLLVGCSRAVSADLLAVV